MSVELPLVVSRYLENYGMVAVPQHELDKLRNKDEPESCPYPLHSGLYGHMNHKKYVGQICEKGDTPKEYVLSGLLVVQCEACQHVTFETPMVFA